MRRKFLFTWCGLALVFAANGQIKKQFTVEDSPNCEDVRLSLKANSGNCFIRPSESPELLNVFSNQSETAFSHNYRKEINGKTCNVSLSLEEAQTEGISQTISTRVFGNPQNNTSDKIWKMYLTESKPYYLELDYGVGRANVDLSGLSIRKLKITTASADVVVGYFSALGNQMEMDTFFIKVDVGSVKVKHVDLARTRHLLADVGFGSMTLDFANRPVVGSRIKGSVGAGNLIILLPSEDTPILVKIKDSWLCSVKMPAGLKKIRENTFANAAYTNDVKNPLIFDLDVSMGNIIFKERE